MAALKSDVCELKNNDWYIDWYVKGDINWQSNKLFWMSLGVSFPYVCPLFLYPQTHTHQFFQK